MAAQILNNRYELLDVLGQGGMATVYRGRDIRLNRSVAVKLLHPQFVTDEEFLQRFEHEAQAAAGLAAHPNIVDVFDVGQDDGEPYIVMELLEGRDLSVVIANEGPLPPERALRIAEQVADGLDFAHQRGLVHRDIKPQNIMIVGRDEVKITDFGIAKSILSTAVTQAGMTFGTADYISPEQAQGLNVTPQSDLYSLGIVIYQMLTKRLPFTGDTPMAVALQQIQNLPPPITRMNPAVPASLERIIMPALAKDPRRRPASVRGFAQQLRDYRMARSQPTQVVPTQRPTTPETPAPPKPLVPAPPLPVAIPSAPKTSPLATILIGLMLLVIAGSAGVFAYRNGFLNSFLGRTGLVPGRQPTVTPTILGTPIVLVKIPNYIGAPESAVRASIEGAGLVPEPHDPRPDPQPAGTVLEQDPAPESNVPKGGKVRIVVSLGPAAVPPTPTPQLIELPSLTNQDANTIVPRLQGAGLPTNIVNQPSQIVPAGRIINQSPGPGLYPPGTIITLIVSQGDVVPFPDVVGLERGEAERLILGNSQLELDVVDEQGPDRLPNFDQIPPNQVVSATANGQPVQNGQLVPRTARIVLGVRRP